MPSQTQQTKNDIKILGYSERGLINSLIYELKFSGHGLALLNDLLSMIKFPYLNDTIKFQITEATVFNELNLSDFGQPDIVLLITNNNINQTIFIEAKVKTSQSPCWKIAEHFNLFDEGINKKSVDSSNLFTQLYHKVRFINALKANGIKQLQEGIQFSDSSTKELRKIGYNDIVLKAIEKIMSYSNNVLYVALIPGDDKELEGFYNTTLKSYRPNDLKDWNITNWGYISWQTLEKFCKEKNLETTINNFDFNKSNLKKGQIY